jgi:hypothetical protein
VCLGVKSSDIALHRLNFMVIKLAGGARGGGGGGAGRRMKVRGLSCHPWSQNAQLGHFCYLCTAQKAAPGGGGGGFGW